MRVCSDGHKKGPRCRPLRCDLGGGSAVFALFHLALHLFHPLLHLFGKCIRLRGVNNGSTVWITRRERFGASLGRQLSWLAPLLVLLLLALLVDRFSRQPTTWIIGDPQLSEPPYARPAVLEMDLHLPGTMAQTFPQLKTFAQIHML